MPDHPSAASPSRSRRPLAMAMMVVVIALLAIAGPVSATTILRERYAEDYSFTYPCGTVEIGVEGHVDGIVHFRVGKGRFATAFFAHDNFAYREVHTNPDGEILVISGNGVFQETRAVALGDNRFAFSARVAGQPLTVRDADGNVLVRDRGVIRETIIFDTLGDSTPGGIFIDSVSFDVAGPHDGLGFDTCDILG